jgi:hypothetical protein
LFSVCQRLEKKFRVTSRPSKSETDFVPAKPFPTTDDAPLLHVALIRASDHLHTSATR